jgi:hypothetical protein
MQQWFLPFNDSDMAKLEADFLSVNALHTLWSTENCPYNYIELRPSWEANSFSACQYIANFLWSPKVHYRLHNSQRTEGLLWGMKLIYTFLILSIPRVALVIGYIHQHTHIRFIKLQVIHKHELPHMFQQ